MKLYTRVAGQGLVDVLEDGQGALLVKCLMRGLLRLRQGLHDCSEYNHDISRSVARRR